MPVVMSINQSTTLFTLSLHLAIIFVISLGGLKFEPPSCARLCAQQLPSRVVLCILRYTEERKRCNVLLPLVAKVYDVRLSYDS